MSEENFNLSQYSAASNLITDGKILEGIKLFSESLSSKYSGTKILFEYDSLIENKPPHLADPQWIHKGDQTSEISGNILRLTSFGTGESTYERFLPVVSNGIFVDFIMRRIGGGTENCFLSLDCNLGSEILRINENSIHVSSNSSRHILKSNEYNSFRLILEDGIEIIAVNGIPVLFSTPSNSLQTSKITFGSTPSNPPAAVESLWPLIRVGTGKNLINNLLSSKLSDSLFYSAEKLFNPINNAKCIRDLHRSLLVNPTNSKSLQLLESLMQQIQQRDPALYLVDDVLSKINNPQLQNYWNLKKDNLHYEEVIDVNNVGVKFNIYGNAGTFAGMWESFFSKNKKKEKFFWALRNISFKVKRGEIIGIIGKNGSGKSTLLRVIANILTPDEGYATVNGKSILLYPGMVFREEISGRENIYLGCLFMGMNRKEIDQEFDAIVDFAELRNDIDRTFKYYSDGMKSRLSFSVATHIKHDILLLDELLSAGDVSFTEKAAKRMEELVTQSKSAVIVTHSTSFIREHCTRAAYIEWSKLKYFGDPDKAVDMYLNDSKIG